MRHIGAREDPTLLQEVGHDPVSVVEGVRVLTSLDKRPDAIAVVHTAGTPHALEELQRQGYVIGSDIGFIGTEVSQSEWGNVLSPRLTSIRIPGYAIGRTGTTRLIERLQGDASAPRRVTVPSDLIIRDSTPRRES